MKGVRGLAGVAAVMLALGVVARAADDSMTGTGNGSDSMISPAPSDTASPSDTSSDNTSNAGQATPTRGALMQGLDSVGLGKSLDNLGITVGGYAEGGYFYDASSPRDITPAKSEPSDLIFFPGVYKNAFMLNQADIAIQRDIEFNSDNWNFGFKLEGGYGRDFFFTHSHGILDWDNHNGGANSDFSQPDLVQAYVTVNIPVGNGIMVKAGKFTDMLGVEQINPTENLFYTHSYAFGFGLPYTQTGLIGSYQFVGDTTTVDHSDLSLGLTRGWNQSSSDNNGEPDYIIQLAHTSGNATFKATVLVGPEGVLPYGPPDHKDWWFVPDLNVKYQLSDDLSLTGDLLYGDAPNTAQWVSLSAYARYQINSMFAANGRVEFYYDKDGVTTGVGGTDVDYTEISLGAEIHPLPDNSIFSTLTVRPEIRCDFASQAVLDITKRDMATASVDVYWKF